MEGRAPEQNEESALLNLSNLETDTKSIYEAIKDVSCSSAGDKPNRNPVLQTLNYSRNKTNLDRIMDDYYCKICKAHMNSEDMWESHISGKRHLKNLKKENEAPHPSRQEKDNEDLCNRSASSTSEVANSTHRKLYVRQRSRSPYSIDSSRRYCSSDSYSSHRKKAYTSPPDGKWRHDRFYLHEQSPPPPSRHSSHSSYSKDELQQLLGSDKIDMMKKMSKNFIIVSENDSEKVKHVVTSLYGEYILARIKKSSH